MDTSPSTTVIPKGRTKRIKQLTGALPTPESNDVASVEATVGVKNTVAASNPTVRLKHQTHGAYTPIIGPITNVDQLRRRPSLTKGAPSSFASVEEYGDYLHTLTIAELHRHAVEQARIVPIDDRTRLIRRLENEWSAILAREGVAKPAPKRVPFTSEQLAKQDEIRRKLLRR